MLASSIPTRLQLAEKKSMRILKSLAAIVFAVAMPCLALAQTSPNLSYGDKLTAGQWNAFFAGKQDTLGYTPLNSAGGVMLGRLVTAPPGSTTAGLNLTPGTAPASPANGDIWTTAAGIYAQINGATIGPLSSAEAAAFAATSPLAVSFAGALTTYALNFNSSLVKDGGSNLGINLGNANIFTATQTFPNNSLTLTEFPAIGANTVLGSVAGGTPAALSQAQLTSFINAATASLSGALPAWPSNTTTFFRGDGSYATLNFAALGGAATLGQLPTGISDTALGYWGSTTASALAINNCANALTYNTTTHAFGCNTTAGTGTVTTGGNGLTLSGGGSTLGITAPVSAANGGTGVVSPTAHTIPINEAASSQNNTGTGILGQALISGGSSADPSYKSGVRVLLNTLTANNTSGTLSDTTSITSSYNDYEIVFENLLNATNLTACQMQVHSGGAFQATGYLANAVTVASSTVLAVGNNVAGLLCSGPSELLNSGPGISGTIRIYSAAQTSSPKMMSGILSHAFTGPAVLGLTTYGYWNGGNGAVDGFQVQAIAGNWVSGTIKIYGLL